MAQTTINDGDLGGTIRAALNTMFGELYASGYYIEVANYSALPAAASHTGEIYVCLADEGTWLLGTKKAAGLWTSNGTTWTRLGPALNAAAIYFSAAGGVAGTDVQAAIEEIDNEKLPKTGGTLARVYELAVGLYELSTNTTLDLSSANIHLFNIAQNLQITMPAVPTTYSQSGILLIKNATGKAHTWNTSPAIRFIGETDADTVPPPAADGKYTRYAYQSVYDGAASYWAITVAGKDTA